MKKEELYDFGIKYIIKFCEANNIKTPKVHKTHIYKNCGYYDYKNKSIYIDLSHCANEADNPGFCWSHRHYFVDREPCGVLCHELGHYLHDVLTDTKLTLPKERKITSYEPNKYERFAETIKLFILNPDLLNKYDPKRYDVLVNKLKLKPIITTDWKTTFGDINEKYIKACEKRINNIKNT